jgi:nucleoside-diphosphate-sugar epimerase
MGLRLVQALARLPAKHEIHVLNRTGQVPGDLDLVRHKGDRRNLKHTYLQESWDIIYDFCCYTQEEAEHTVEYFGKDVGKYIFISSMSVYEMGANISEKNFDPLKLDLNRSAAAAEGTGEAYREGKQRAEAVFFQKGMFPTLAVRIPMVTGPDDYTRRLQFHIERVANSRQIYIPKIEARISLIQSQDAADFFLWALNQNISGPLNVAPKHPIALEGFIAHVESACKRKALLAGRPDENNISPYGVMGDWFMDVSLCESKGFACQPIQQWLPGLIEWMASENEARILH